MVLNFGKYDVLNYPRWSGGSTCIILRLICFRLVVMLTANAAKG